MLNMRRILALFYSLYYCRHSTLFLHLPPTNANFNHIQLSPMYFFQATGILGTFNTIAGILLSIRKCYKAKKKISSLVSDSLSSLENIKHVAPHISRFVEVGGIDARDFCAIAEKFLRIEVDLTNMRARMQKKENRIWNKISNIYLFCSAAETVAGLESICTKLAQMETEMRLLVTSVRTDVKTSVMLEAFIPVLAVVEEIIPHIDGLKEKKQLVTDARKAFGTQVLSSRMNRLVSTDTQSIYYTIIGKMFFEGMPVEVGFEKSPSFFQSAINCGSTEALYYLGWQYEEGLGVSEDKRKAM